MNPGRRRIVITVVSGATVGILMILFGMEPRVAVLACVVAAVAGAAWLLVDLGPASGHLVWNEPDAPADATAGADHRVHALRARLQRSSRTGRLPLARTADAVSTDEIAESLLALLDDHLLAEHRLDRRTEPAAAAAVLGPDLTRFVEDPGARRSMTQRRALPRTLALIEDLVAHPASPGGPPA